jgi:riboflavin synthase alpha subunit
MTSRPLGSAPRSAARAARGPLRVVSLFTGIVQGRATVRDVVEKTEFRSIKLQLPEGKAANIQLGASVAVNGTCLTGAWMRRGCTRTCYAIRSFSSSPFQDSTPFCRPRLSDCDTISPLPSHYQSTFIYTPYAYIAYTRAVTEIAGDLLSFDIIAETLRKTNLGELSPGAAANYERSARVGDEIGGHNVSGHVHTTAAVDKVEVTENNQRWQFRVREPAQWMKYILPKVRGNARVFLQPFNNRTVWL